MGETSGLPAGQAGRAIGVCSVDELWLGPARLGYRRSVVQTIGVLRETHNGGLACRAQSFARLGVEGLMGARTSKLPPWK